MRSRATKPDGAARSAAMGNPWGSETASRAHPLIDELVCSDFKPPVCCGSPASTSKTGVGAVRSRTPPTSRAEDQASLRYKVCWVTAASATKHPAVLSISFNQAGSASLASVAASTAAMLSKPVSQPTAP